jgi:hypothetical protein
MQGHPCAFLSYGAVRRLVSLRDVRRRGTLQSYF